MGDTILSTVKKAARLAVYEEMMISVKNHHTPPTMRPDRDLRPKGRGVRSADINYEGCRQGLRASLDPVSRAVRPHLPSPLSAGCENADVREKPSALGASSQIRAYRVAVLQGDKAPQVPIHTHFHTHIYNKTHASNGNITNTHKPFVKCSYIYTKCLCIHVQMHL